MLIITSIGLKKAETHYAMNSEGQFARRTLRLTIFVTIFADSREINELLQLVSLEEGELQGNSPMKL